MPLNKLAPLFSVILLGFVAVMIIILNQITNPFPSASLAQVYWFDLQRQSNVETLYTGIPGDRINSLVVRTFRVKTGIPEERPTPLPKLMHRNYWVIKNKFASDNPETAPYFLTLNIPVSDNPPYGPEPYMECNGQCNWQIPGPFGLHGVGGDLSKLSVGDPGSSGCIRHSDSDITYLYNHLDPQIQEIRYYIENN